MSLRDFTDSSGRSWRVWETFPSTLPSQGAGSSAFSRFMGAQPDQEGNTSRTVRKSYKDGWLTFTSGSERRRLAPIPSNWEQDSEARLREYLERSDQIPERRRTDRPS